MPRSPLSGKLQPCNPSSHHLQQCCCHRTPAGERAGKACCAPFAAVLCAPSQAIPANRSARCQKDLAVWSSGFALGQSISETKKNREREKERERERERERETLNSKCQWSSFQSHSRLVLPNSSKGPTIIPMTSRNKTGRSCCQNKQ